MNESRFIRFFHVVFRASMGLNAISYQVVHRLYSLFSPCFFP